MDHLEHRIAKWAASHHGLITRRVAGELGFDRGRISRRLKSGEWVRIRAGVYRIAGAPHSERTTLLASVLPRSDTYAARASAAALHGLPGFTLLPPHVVTARTRRANHVGADARQSLFIPCDHVSTVDAIPCTTPARTLFDLCGSLHPLRAERAMDDALVRQFVTTTQCWHVLLDLAEHGRSGTVRFRELLMARSDGRAIVESELEAAFLRLCRRFGLPEPERQVTLGDDDGIIGRVDFLFRPWRLVVECDGRIWHTAKLDAERDAARDERLTAIGLAVCRLTWGDVVRRGADTANELKRFGAHTARSA